MKSFEAVLQNNIVVEAKTLRKILKNVPNSMGIYPINKKVKSGGNNGFSI